MAAAREIVRELSKTMSAHGVGASKPTQQTQTQQTQTQQTQQTQTQTQQTQMKNQEARAATPLQGTQLLQRYHVGRCIGSGLTARVYEGVDTKLCTEVAIKVLSRRQLNRLRLVDSIVREIQYGAALSESSAEDDTFDGGRGHIVRLLDSFILDDGDALVIVFELVKGRDLFEIVSSCPGGAGLDECDTRAIFTQLIRGLAFIHARGFCHRDIKPENILVEEGCMMDFFKTWHVKISDFGFSRHLQSTTGTKFIGSVQYMAPEVIGKTAGHAYQSSNTSSGYCAAPVGGDGNYDGRTIDMWSCGVVLYVCTYGVYPFEDVDRPEDNKRTWFNITHGKYALPEFVEREVVVSAGQIKCVNVPVSASLRSLISDLLVVDPGRRPSAAEVLEHPFLASGGHAFPQSSSAADSAKLDNASGGLHQYDLQDWGSAGDLFSNMPSIAPPLFDYDMTTMMS